MYYTPTKRDDTCTCALPAVFALHRVNPVTNPNKFNRTRARVHEVGNPAEVGALFTTVLI